MSSAYMFIGSERTSRRRSMAVLKTPHHFDPCLNVGRTRQLLADSGPRVDVEGEGDVAELALRPLAARAEKREAHVRVRAGAHEL
eukprot:2776045-Alexandrium_andersonii.AAC.1